MKMLIVLNVLGALLAIGWNVFLVFAQYASGFSAAAGRARSVQPWFSMGVLVVTALGIALSHLDDKKRSFFWACIPFVAVALAFLGLLRSQGILKT